MIPSVDSGRGNENGGGNEKIQLQPLPIGRHVGESRCFPILVAPASTLQYLCANVSRPVNFRYRSLFDQLQIWEAHAAHVEPTASIYSDRFTPAWTEPEYPCSQLKRKRERPVRVGTLFVPAVCCFTQRDLRRAYGLIRLDHPPLPATL
jgi:hypothetical protein